MRRLFVVTQEVDPAHPALAATVPKLRALAERVDEVVVFASTSAPGVLPENCRVRSYRAGTRLGRGARFEAALVRELTRGRPLAVLAHMCPIYAVLAAPLARPLRVPVLLWFSHWRPSGLLRRAERLSNAVLTVNRYSFPLASTKLHPIGHGIDVREFPCRSTPAAGPPLRLLALGRTSPAKGLEGLIEAVRRARAGGVEVQLELVGPSLTAEEVAHRELLERLAGDGVRLAGPIERARVSSLFDRVDALVNNSRDGALDKVVFEAGASCVPVLASRPSFDDVLDERLLFDQNDVAGIAARIAQLARLSVDERAELGRALRDRVAAVHSVDSWADGVLRAASGV